MPRAQDASSYIYEGVWSDWSKLKGPSWTLTLSPTNAEILSPAIAVLIALAGGQLWTITQFALHQIRATAAEQDYFYHQQQVTLRNTSSDLNSLWRLVRIALAWRHQKKVKSGRRSVALVTWAIIHVVLVSVCGLFSSSWLNAGVRVLSSSPYCGTFDSKYWNYIQNSTDSDQKKTTYLTNLQSRYSLASQYTQVCDSTTEGCDILPYDGLPWNTTLVDNLCPFDESVCSTNVSGSVVFDTGYLSSHTHLGLNAPPNERVSYRKVMTCTPMNDRDFVSSWIPVPTNDGTMTVQAVDAYYGPTSGHVRNATYSHTEYPRYMAADQFGDLSPYVLDVKFAIAGTKSSFWRPIPQVARSNADVMLAFLSFNGVYQMPVTDPWFSAQKVQQFAYNNWNQKGNGTFYVRQNPVTTLGCTEQHQFCVGDVQSQGSSSKNCTSLQGGSQLNPVYFPLAIQLTPPQLAAYQRILAAAVESSVYGVLRYLNQADLPLLARSLIKNNVGLGLPHNQWQLEAGYWQKLSMSMFQHAVIDWSTGQFAADVSYVNTTMAPSLKKLCQNQIIQSNSYRSYSFLGLILVSVFSIVIIIAGLTVEECMAVWRVKRLTYTDSKQDMWILNGDLEMLRLLSEAHTGAAWSRSKDGIPLAEPGHKSRVSQFRSKFTRPLHSARSVKSFFTTNSDEDIQTQQSPAPSRQNTTDLIKYEKYNFSPNFSRQYYI